jgi:hypothetical protein
MISLSGWDFKIEFGPQGRITFIGWSAVHRMITYLEFKIYGYSDERWRHIFDPCLAVRYSENYVFLVHAGPKIVKTDLIDLCKKIHAASHYGC